MDTPEARAGTTIYLGVNVEGALFSIGDGHYTMGEGEVCGVAVEGAMDTLLTVELIKGVYCEWPRLEDDESIMVAGSYRPLEDAFRIAHTQLIRWICRRDRPVADGHLPARDPGVTLADRQRVRRQLHDRGQDAEAISARRHGLDGRRARTPSTDRRGGAGHSIGTPGAGSRRVGSRSGVERSFQAGRIRPARPGPATLGPPRIVERNRS